MKAASRLLAILAALALSAAAPPSVEKGKKKWTPCEIKVTNRTPFRVLIHVDGVYWGWVNAQQTFTFKGIPEGTVVVYGDTQYAEYFWGPKPMKCQGTVPWDLAF